VSHPFRFFVPRVPSTVDGTVIALRFEYG
jgi:hypothetical protein